MKSGRVFYVGLMVTAVLLPLLAGALAPAASTSVPWVRHTIDSSSQGADGVRLADANGDGLPDVTTGWEQGGKIRVYLNPGPAQVKRPWPAITSGEVASPEDAVLVDLDGDGALDVVSSCQGRTRTIFVHWAPHSKDLYRDAAAWKTEPLAPSEGARQWMFSLPMQIDGWNGLDLVSGAKNQGAQIGWFESPQRPRHLAEWRWHPFYDAGWIMSLLAHDMDGDGDSDIVASDRKGPKRGCLWIENPGSQQASRGPWRVHRIGSLNEYEVMFLTIVDLDHDGLDDVLAAAKDAPLLYHRRVAGKPLRWQTYPIGLPVNAGTGKAVKAADINLDGKTDIVFSCENARQGKSGVMWLSYRKAVTDRLWVAHEISGPEGAKFDLVELQDLDQDGDLDVITCEETDNLGVVWYENPVR